MGIPEKALTKTVFGAGWDGANNWAHNFDQGHVAQMVPCVRAANLQVTVEAAGLTV
jgi:hypothetical protein